MSRKSSRPQLDLSYLDPSQYAELRDLTRSPRYAWPVICLWLVVIGTYLSSYVFAFLGHIPLWVGMVVNSLIGYYAFTVVHDAIHRSITRRPQLNEFIGQSAALLGAPYLSLKLFRWGHLQHHRYTGGPGDPDLILHGKAWTLPFRWLVIDVLYLRHTLRYLRETDDNAVRKLLRESLLMALVTGVVFAAATAAGYGMHLVMLWLIPSRIIFLSLGFSFFWLPHAPHDTAQSENFTRATTMRLGWEWLLGPLLQNQNYHLIHHLYPGTPSSNHGKVWKLTKTALKRHDMAIQPPFRIKPKIVRGMQEPIPSVPTI